MWPWLRRIASTSPLVVGHKPCRRYCGERFFTLACPIASFVPWARALRRHKDADAHFVLLTSRLRNAPFVDNGRAAGVDNGCAAGIDRPQMRSVGTPALGPCRALGGKLVPVLLGWRHFLMGTRVRPLACHPSQDHTTRPGWILSKQCAPCL